MAELGELYWTLAVQDDVSKELKTIQDALKGTNNLLVNLSDTFEEGFNTSALDSIGRSTAEMGSQMKSLEQLWSKLSFEDKFNGDAYSADAQKIIDSYRRIMESAKQKGNTLQGLIKEEITAQEKLIKEQEKAQAVAARERITSRKSDMVAALREQEKATQEAEKQRAKRVEILRVLRQEETTITAIRQKLALMTQIQDKSKLDSKQFENARKEIERLNSVLGQYQATSRSASSANNQFAASAGNVARETKRQNLVVTELMTTLRNFAGFYFARDAVKQLAEVTGQFELQKVSLQAITQNATEANKVFAQLQQLAVKSPYQFTEILAGAKQLAAFQVPLKDLYSTTKVITDLSAGLGVDMGRIILAYGQVQAAAVLRGQELRQFTEAGIPLVQLLADKFTILKGEVVSASEVFDLISTRAVSFEMVKEIFTDLTSEGGKFYDMQAIQAETLQGKISNLTDAYQLMLNEIGTNTEGVLKGMLDSVRYIMDNWSEVLNILMSIGAAYGVLRTSQTINVALSGKENSALISSVLANKAKTIEMAKQASVYRALSVEELRAISSKNMLMASDLRQLVVSGAVTKDMLLRMVATKKLSVEQAMLLVTTKALTAEEIARAAAMNRSTLIMNQISLGFQSIGRSLLALATNPMTWIFTAIASIGYLVSRYTSFGDKIQKEHDDASKSVRDFADNISTSYDKIAEAIENTLGKGSPAAIEKSIQALIDLVGTSKELTVVLLEGTESISDRNEVLRIMSDNMKSIVQGSNDASSAFNSFVAATESTGGNWFTSIFTDNIVENINDFEKAISKMNISLGKSNIPAYRTELQTLISSLRKGELSFEETKKVIEEINKTITFPGGTIARSGYNNILDELVKVQSSFKDVESDYQDMIDFINKQYPDVTNWENASSEQKSSFIRTREAWIQANTDMSEFSAKWLTDLTNKTYFIDAEVRIGNVEQSLSGWKKRVSELTPSIDFGKNLSEFEGLAEVLSLAKSKIKDLNTELEVLMKIPIGEKRKETQDRINQIYTELGELTILQKEYNQSVEDEGKENKKASKTAKERYEEELTLIKKVYSDYNDLRKLMGDEAAQSKIKELYKGLLPDIDMAFSPDQFIAALEKMSKKFAGVKAQKAVIGVEVDINKEKLDNLSKDIKTALDKAAKEVERHKEQFDIYKNLIAKGFEEGRAQTLAFGVDFKVQEGGYNIGQYLADSLAQSLDVTIPGLTLDFSIDTSFIDQIGAEYSKLDDTQRKQVETLEKERFEMKKNYFMQYANLVMKESPEGMGMQFDLSNVFAKYKEELIKLQDAARQAMESEQYKKGKAPGASEEDKAEAERLDRNIKLAKDANAKIALDKARQTGSVYLKEKMEIAGLGELYKNMSSASAASIESMLSVVRKYTDDLLEGTQTRLTEMGLGEFAEMFQGVFNAEGLTAYTEELDKVIAGLTTLDPTVIGKATPTPEQVQKMLQFATAQRSVALNTKQVGTELQSVKADNVLKAYKSMGDSVKKVIDSVQGLGEAFGIEFNDISKSAIKLSSTLVDSSLDVIDTISTTAKAAGTGMSVTAIMAAESIKTVEKASVILAIIGAALQVATAIANLFASSAKKKNEDIIKNSEAQIRRLENAYSDLDRQVNKALGEDVNKNQVKQIQNLQAQSNELNKQLATVGQKGGLSNEEAEELQRKQVELKQQQEDLIDGLRDSILGSTKDLAQELGNAFFEAFANGEDAAIAWGKKVDEIVSGIVKKMLIQTLLEKPLGQALEKFSNSFINKATGAIDYDKMQEGIGNFANEINVIGSNFSDAIQKAIDANPALKDILMGGGAGGQGTAEGIKAITEDTANRLAGYMNSMRAEMIIQSGYLASIMGSMSLISTTATAQLGVLNSQLAHLRSINSILSGVLDPSGRSIRVS